MSFRVFSSRRSSLTQIFVESCLDFEVAHLSVLMVRRLAYAEIPTLTVHLLDTCCLTAFCACHPTACMLHKSRPMYVASTDEDWPDGHLPVAESLQESLEPLFNVSMQD